MTHIAKITLSFKGPLNAYQEDKHQVLSTYKVNPKIFLTNVKKRSNKDKKKDVVGGGGSGGGGGGGDDDDDPRTAEEIENDPTTVTLKKLSRVMITSMKMLGYQNTFPFPLILKLKGIEGRYGNDDTGILVYASHTSTEEKDLEYTNYAINPEMMRRYGHLTQKDLLDGLDPIGKHSFLVPRYHECVDVLMKNSIEQKKQLFVPKLIPITDASNPQAPVQEKYQISAEMVYLANDLLMTNVISKMPTVDLTKLEGKISRYSFDDKVLAMFSTVQTDVEGADADSELRKLFMAKNRYAIIELQIEFETWERVKKQ